MMPALGNARRHPYRVPDGLVDVLTAPRSENVGRGVHNNHFWVETRLKGLQDLLALGAKHVDEAELRRKECIRSVESRSVTIFDDRLRFLGGHVGFQEHHISTPADLESEPRRPVVERLRELVQDATFSEALASEHDHVRRGAEKPSDEPVLDFVGSRQDLICGGER